MGGALDTSVTEDAEIVAVAHPQPVVDRVVGNRVGIVQGAAGRRCEALVDRTVREKLLAEYEAGSRIFDCRRGSFEEKHSLV